MRPSNLFNIFWGRAPATPARYLTMNVQHGSVPPHTATLFFTRFVSNVELIGWMPYVSPKHSWRNLGSSAPCWCSRAPSSCRYIPDSAQALRSFPRRAWSSRHRPKNIPERIKGGDHWGNPLPTWKKPHQKGNVVELSSPPGISKKKQLQQKQLSEFGFEARALSSRSVSHQESGFTQQTLTGIRDSYQPQHTFVAYLWKWHPFFGPSSPSFKKICVISRSDLENDAAGIANLCAGDLFFILLLLL